MTTKKSAEPADPNALHVEQMEGFVPPEPERSFSVWDMLADEAKPTKGKSAAPTESGE